MKIEHLFLTNLKSVSAIRNCFPERINGLSPQTISVVDMVTLTFIREVHKCYCERGIDRCFPIKVSSQSRRSEFRVFSMVHLNMCNC